jgi:hypothetical protein
MKAKKMRKVLNPNLVSKREQAEIEKSVQDVLKIYPFREAMKHAMVKMRRVGHH